MSENFFKNCFNINNNKKSESSASENSAAARKNWRQKIADSLTDARKNWSGHSDIDILAGQKGSDAYIDKEVLRRQEKFNERRQKEISKAVAECQDYNDLKNIFLNHELLEISGDHLGCDYGANFAKKMEIARAVGDLSIVPEFGGLRAKIAEFFPEEFPKKINQSEKNERYKNFLMQRFPELNFSKKEIDRIVAKLPAEVFGSVDVATEKSLLLLNSVNEIKTVNSCGGHFDAQNIDDQAYINDFLTNPCVVFTVKNDDYEKVKVLSENFKKATNSFPHIIVHDNDDDGKFCRNSDEKCFTWRYILFPSLEYTIDHGKMSREEIWRKSNNDLKELLGEDVVDVETGSVDKFKISHLQQDLFLRQPEMALGGLDTFGRYAGISTKITHLLPAYRHLNEYKEYYHSPELRQEVSEFFSKINEVLNNWRETNKS